MGCFGTTMICRNPLIARTSSLRLVFLATVMVSVSVFAGLAATSSLHQGAHPEPARIFESGIGPSPGVYFDHVVVITMENEGISDICGRNPPPCNGVNSTYMSSLANSYGIAQQYTSLVTQSEP
ncbi:hypothetical protein J2P12_08780, partial [Candidatus Bathyarchaeota archaeon]|nr:hypothetical protein [Candidatus Bathyarchaeota archaeon]